jgi:hypothetical protein
MKPLLAELALREKINQNLLTENYEKQQLTAAMKAVINTPRLLREFQRCQKRRVESPNE